METKTTKNKTGKARKNIGNINRNIRYIIACDNRRLLSQEDWSVIPILNSWQVSNGKAIANAQF